MSDVLDNNESTGKRPVFLTVVCILSFVGIGLAILGYITAISLLGMAESAMSEVSAAVEEAGGASASVSTGLIWTYIIIGFATALVSLFGVVKMWKLEKAGFIMYTGAAIVGLIMGIVYSGLNASIMGIVFTGAFIAMYAANLKHMK